MDSSSFFQLDMYSMIDLIGVWEYFDIQREEIFKVRLLSAFQRTCLFHRSEKNPIFAYGSLKKVTGYDDIP